MTGYQATIVAQATPPGCGGVSIVRVSGPEVKKIAQAILGELPPPRTAYFSSFKDEQNQVLDQGIAIFFQSPHSFTSEDVLELQGHGGPMIVSLMIQRILNLGARLARPGEFSERAFLNGKIDLTQAESIIDLIHAGTEQAARSALRSLQGEFSKKISAIKEALIELRMHIEAAIDFAEEEIDFLSDDTIKHRFNHLVQQVLDLQKSAKQGCLLRDGITAVFAGKPNVGKSTLLNLLSEKELAIVTDIPGTTRDILSEHIQIDGLVLHIIDTAGLRTTSDPIEQEGIRRTQKAIEQADLLIYVTDATSPSCLEENDMLATLNCRPSIIIRNKIDLLGEQSSLIEKNGIQIVSLSAKENQGLALLKQAIKAQAGFSPQAGGNFSARQRHLAALDQAKCFITTAFHQLETSRAAELMAEDLRQAQHFLSEITGAFTTEDLLGRIFSQFCIGK